jgi:hypothetical protein
MFTPWKVSGGVCILALTLFAADSSFVGTWKQNPAKSKMEGSGLEPNTTIHIEPEGNGLKVSVEATSKGQPANFTYQATLDGKIAKVTGSALIDEVAIMRFNDRTIAATGKKDGKTVFSDMCVVSSDRKTMTISRTGTNPEGKPFKAKMTFDKQ